jgi:hypothetical protein
MRAWLALILVTGCRSDPHDWEVLLADTHARLTASPILGLGLTAPLALTLQHYELGLYTAPANVRWTIDRPGNLEITRGGTIEFPEGKATRVDLRPTAAGPNRVRFISDSTDEKFELAFTVAEPGSGVIVLVDLSDPPIADLEARGTTLARVFAGSTTTVLTEYRALDSRALVGRGTVTVTSAALGTTVDDDRLTCDPAPHTFELAATPPAGGVGGVSAMVDDIACIRVLVQGVVKVTSIELQAGRTVTLLPVPCDSTATDILGRPRPPLTTRVSGDAIVVATEQDGELLTVRGVRAGAAMLQLDWGAASVTLPVTVTDGGG